MRKRTITSGAVAIAAASAIGIAGTVVAQAQETGDQTLADALDEILSDPRLTDSQAGVVVADADTGETVYDHNGDTRIDSGSNIKLTTSAAALEVLGEDYTFTTQAITADRPRHGVVYGDLYLRGGGDPTLLQADLEAMAAEIADSGVEVVVGDLVADDSAFDDERLGTEYGWDDLQYLYANETAALTVASGDDYNAGTVRVFVDPGDGEGDPAHITTVPETDYVTIDNQITTGEAGSDTSVAINRDDHENTIRLTGTIAADSGGTYGTRAVIDPALLAADVFENALEAEGVYVTGDLRGGTAPEEDGRTVAEHHSAPLSELTVDLLKPSNASMANALFKTIGYELSGEGTWATGKAGVYQGIEKYGVDTGPVRQVDGSGVSRHNLITPTMVTDLLVGAKDAPWFDTWYGALPIACEDGTIAGRMCDTPAAGNVHAKTGSKTSVSALSGYATDADGRELVFSVMLNDYLWWTVKDIEDQIAAAIAGHSQDSTESEFSTFSETDEAPEGGLNEDAEPELECTWVEPAVC